MRQGTARQYRHRKAGSAMLWAPPGPRPTSSFAKGNHFFTKRDNGKPIFEGKADMSIVSKLVKELLS